MADRPITSVEGLPDSGEPDAVETLAKAEPETPSLPEHERSETLKLLEETLTGSKRRRSTGRVRVDIRTETVAELAEVALDRRSVEVTRVPVGSVVTKAPGERTEGDTTVISVVEERMVVMKQIFLVEEVHIRHVLDREIVREPVTLRHQHAIVERLDPSVGLDSVEPTSSQDTALGAEGGHHGSVG